MSCYRDQVTLNDLVPADNFYRHVERTLDLSFVRNLVRDRYAAGGRPSIDPVVFFKLQLVLFFEGMRSERQLERVGSDRLSVRWYLGYDLHEPLPDHSSMTRIRDRYGINIFRQFFEKVVDWCQHEGLVWGKELYADATLVEADADRDKMLPRFAVERHIVGLFGPAAGPPKQPDLANETPEAVSSEPEASLDTNPAPRELGVVLSTEQATRLAEQNPVRPDWYAANGEPDRSVQRGSYQRMSDLWVSLTDRDAVLMSSDAFFFTPVTIRTFPRGWSGRRRRRGRSGGFLGAGLTGSSSPGPSCRGSPSDAQPGQSPPWWSWGSGRCGSTPRRPGWWSKSRYAVRSAQPETGTAPPLHPGCAAHSQCHPG